MSDAQHRHTDREKGGLGFSLIEVLVVLLIMGIVTAQMFVVFSSQKRVYLTNDRALEVQESARLIADLIARDTRMAGFMIPRWLSVASFDGGAVNPDRLCVSEAAYFSAPLDGTPSALDGRADRFSGATVAAVAGTTITLNATEMNIDGENAIDFTVNGGIIISDGTRTWCTQILTMPGLGTITVQDPPTFFAPGSTDAVPAIIYENDSANLTLTRNGMVLSNSVEDLQVEYWVDNQIPDDAMGGTEFPINDLNDTTLGWTIDPSRIRRVQISIVTRSPQGDGFEGEIMNRFRRPAVANRAAGPQDDLPRRRFTVHVLPRNIL